MTTHQIAAMRCLAEELAKLSPNDHSGLRLLQVMANELIQNTSTATQKFERERAQYREVNNLPKP